MFDADNLKKIMHFFVFCMMHGQKVCEIIQYPLKNDWYFTKRNFAIDISLEEMHFLKGLATMLFLDFISLRCDT